MGPIWGRQDPGGPRVGPMNFAIWDGNWRVNLDCWHIQGKCFHSLMSCSNSSIFHLDASSHSMEYGYPNGTEAGREAGWGSEFVPLKKREVESFTLLHKNSRAARYFGIRTPLKQYHCYESANIPYTDLQYLAQYREIINNLQEMPLMFCHYAVRYCGTWRKWPGQSPGNVLSISDLELYLIERNTDVCDPVTD